MASVRDDLEELFIYSLEEHRQVPLRQRLEQERARRSIPQSDWAQYLLVTDHNRQPLVYDPVPIDFEVHIYWQGPERFLRTPDQRTENSQLRNLQVQPSDPLVVEVIVMRLGRSDKLFREAFLRDPQLQGMLTECQDAQGLAGAKLVCRMTHREIIMRYFEEHGAMVQGEVLKLSRMKPRHILVAEEFNGVVNQIVNSLPRKARGKVERITNLAVPVLDLTNESSGPVDESRNTNPPSYNVHVHAAERVGRAHPYSRSSVQAMTSSGSRSTSSSSASTNAFMSQPSASALSAGHSSQSLLEDPLLEHTTSASVGASLSVNDDQDCPSTQIDEDEENDAQDEGAKGLSINSVESHSIVIYRTFVHVPQAPISEGAQTASTGARICVNPRRVAKHVRMATATTAVRGNQEDSQSASTPSMSSPSVSTPTLSPPASVPSSLTSSLPLGSLQFESQD